MNINKDYYKRATAYSLLAHIKNNGTLATGPLDIFVPIVKNALSELYPDGTIRGGNISEISDTIEQNFALDFPIPVMKSILNIIAEEINKKSDKEDMRIFNDGAFWIEKYIFEDYSELIKDSKNNVAKVVSLFNKFCKIYNIDSPNNEVDLFKFIDQNRADISYYLSHDQKECISQSVIAAQFVDTFRNVDGLFDNLRNIYLGSMLASYLEYQPTQVKMNVELLLDTNFIISLLDLNTPESTKTCNTLIDVSRTLGYSFTILKDTIEEIQGLLSFKSENLSSAIIAKAINREDIYNACDRKHLTSADLDRIADNIEEMLTKDYNFSIIQNTTKWQNKAKFSKEYSLLKSFRNTEKSALHDAMALLYVKEKRNDKKIYEFEKVNCWFVNNAITHDNEHDNGETKLFQGKTSEQPEIIKVDDLLNILWLSNPSIGIASSDVIDMGLASMVSYTLNSSLPKARIIKELDDNIQKYRNDQSISDTDIIRLSTRIVNRQIKDVQEINELARKNQVEFADRIKDESRRQELIEMERAQKLDDLMSTLTKSIENIKDNQSLMKQKHDERMQQLDLKENKIETENQKLGIEIQELKMKEDNNIKTIQILWKKENKNRNNKKEQYIQENIDRKKAKAKRKMIWGCILFLLVLICSISCYLLLDVETIKKINDLMSFKPVSIILPIIILIIECFLIKNYSNWVNNPSYSANQRSLINIPKEFEEISIEDFIDETNNRPL